MNERIRLLALQAGMGETKLGVGKIHQFYGDGLERFAQLIVQECTDIADEYDGVGSTIVGRIEKHFGVENERTN